MTRLLQELKTRARLRLNAHRRAALAAGNPGAADDPRLRDCLHAVSREAGFAHWEHARHVLGGQAGAGDDQGTFWYAPGCAGLLTPWFARHDEARQAMQQGSPGVVLPYRRQFVLAGPDFLAELGLDADSSLWADAGFDLVRSAGSSTWEALAWQRLRAIGASLPGQAAPRPAPSTTAVPARRGSPR
ncbi:hypothetical protein ACPOLB_19880 [Rubrivivax sp. RP6-9]|uniref:hypothetical protein n=1 Tax=Rubrivivax sp. RP6-9 TaxID=3415750 RepID=UPI003CC52975